MAFLKFSAQSIAAMLATEQTLKEKGVTQSMVSGFSIKDCLNAIKSAFDTSGLWIPETAVPSVGSRSGQCRNGYSGDRRGSRAVYGLAGWSS
jgi:hypothetical protein